MSAAVGYPVVVTVNVPAVPSVNVVASALVIVGALAAATVSVKVWVASGAVPLAAVIVSVVGAGGAGVRRARREWRSRRRCPRTSRPWAESRSR